MDDDSGDSPPKTLPFRHCSLWERDGHRAAEGSGGGKPFSFFTQSPEEYFRTGPPAVVRGDGEAAAVEGLQGGDLPGGFDAGEPGGSQAEAEAAVGTTTAGEAQNVSWAAAQAAVLENWRSARRARELEAAAALSSRRPAPNVDATAKRTASRRMVLVTRDGSRLLAGGGAVEAVLPNEAADGYGSLSSAGRRRKTGPGRPRRPESTAAPPRVEAGCSHGRTF